MEQNRMQTVFSLITVGVLLAGCSTDAERRKAEALARQAASNNSNPAFVGGNIAEMQETAEAENTLNAMLQAGIDPNGTATPTR